MRLRLLALFLLLGLLTLPSTAPATSPAPHLSDLTVSTPAITENSNVTVTLTLSSPAPIGGARVILGNDATALTVPPSITVPARAITRTFSISSGEIKNAAYATISGSYGGWTQEVGLKVLPPNLSYDIPRMTVAPGNGCAVVMWAKVPDNMMLRYNVYRVSGKTAVLLTPKPVWFNYFPDAGLTNDTVTYSYQVAGVDPLGHEHTRCGPVSIIPSSATATLNWINPPTAVTGEVTLGLSLSSGGYAACTFLIIDGQHFDSSSSPRGFVPEVPPITTDAVFNASKLPNGPHVVQFLGFIDEDRTISCVTPPITVQVNDTIGNFPTYNRYFSYGELYLVSATVPSGSTWSLQVTNVDTGRVVRSWQGGAPLIHLAWDGRDAAGNPCALGDYGVQVTVQPAEATGRTGAKVAGRGNVAVSKSQKLTLVKW